jgi:alpha-amylase/alpha-mannosidase (GH57 family)
MYVWHSTPDAAREPRRASAGENVTIHAGTWPVEPRQTAWVETTIRDADGEFRSDVVPCKWRENRGPNSYWTATLGPFRDGDDVTYRVRARGDGADATTGDFSFRVGPKLFVAMLWHHHQPVYKNALHLMQDGSYTQPWVRLHAIRDYYSMAHLVAAHPALHLTINLTPALAWQLEDYLERGATDRALALTLKPAELLGDAEREAVLSSFFDADWHNQILGHERYAELFAQRHEGSAFDDQDVRDLQMWFNLAWFGKEFRDGVVHLATGETASVRRFVEQGRGFTTSDVDDMVEEQYKIMEAIIPVHRYLQECGQIEISTTPFFHPILPLLADTDRATLDRPGTGLPARFSYPEDAAAQVRLAVEWYEGAFGRRPKGMWPAEGAVGQHVLPFFEANGIEWIASDKGVLARSGRWGYDAEIADVLCQPYRPSGPERPCVFFRDTWLSDAIGFHYQHFDDPRAAAHAFVAEVKERFAHRVSDSGDRVLAIVLDGENAWGAYREDARPFLRALYGLLERDPELRTVTFSEYIDGNATRRVAPHPLDEMTAVDNLFTGSWIDEAGSRPGVDLGTWIGEEEENRAWQLLAEARRFLAASGATPSDAPSAYLSAYMAEGSDWFWWYGDDQGSGRDDAFDDLYRGHLKSIYESLGAAAPRRLDEHIAPHAAVWTHSHPIAAVGPGDRLTIRTHCPGRLSWSVDGRDPESADLVPEGGVMAGKSRFSYVLGPFGADARLVDFVFECRHEGCTKTHACCRPRLARVRVGKADSGSALLPGAEARAPDPAIDSMTEPCLDERADGSADGAQQPPASMTRIGAVATVEEPS